ncbi:MAG: ATP-dependent DNA helicase RecG [Pseudomonadota bacterium]
MNSPASISSIPITELKGVGVQLAQKLVRLHLYTIQDVLFHLPYRYEDRTRIYPLRHVQSGMTTTIEGEILEVNVTLRGKRSLVVTLQEGDSRIQIRFFHFNQAQKANMTQGSLMRCFGEVRRVGNKLSMIHPEYQVIGASDEKPLDETLTPLYPTTDGVKLQRLRKITQLACDYIQKAAVDELIPNDYLPDSCKNWTAKAAVLFLHNPTADVSTTLLESMGHPAQIRLIIEEFVAHQLSRLLYKKSHQQQEAKVLKQDDVLHQKFQASLPFEPTKAQQRVIQEIFADISQPYPMLRLVQGDVGSGKTWVAAMAALSAIAAGYQVAIMAPTEILAEQHLNTFQEWFEPLGIRVGWLASKMKAAQKRDTLENLALGLIQLAVGTHALFQETVSYQNLGLVIIDEQHRFGVHQRLSLQSKNEATWSPHQLVMTATPIPRTLAMTEYADMDKSIIDELPPGRTPVKTVVIKDERRHEVVDRVRAACRTGRQAYWVCTLIDESEVLQCQAAESTAEELETQLNPSDDTKPIKVGLVHGRMKPQDKQEVMEAFKNNEIQLLVATTVIEVGVNVPNASLMIIENPERLGLAQLHQLRGRVGRGAIESHCVLLFHAPLSKNGKARLSALRDTNDGFLIAEEDLKIRGPGEILGTRQTGMARYRIADLMRDQGWLSQAQHIANQIFTQTPHLTQPLIARWLGEKNLYRQV